MSLPSKRRFALALALSGIAVLTYSSLASATHVRPQGATPKFDSLVIGYRGCVQQVTVHGGPATSPLSGRPSCAPGPTSPFLTAGTADANGVPPQFTGYVRQTVTTSPPDIVLTADMTDVRCQPSIAGNPALCQPNGPGPPAYKGKTDVVFPIQDTDHCNYAGGGGGPCPAPPTAGTVVTVGLDFPMPCAVPAAPNIGGECKLTTSWNARYPGMVPAASPPANGSRMNIEIGVVKVTDGNDSGVADPNNAVFATSGLFSP